MAAVVVDPKRRDTDRRAEEITNRSLMIAILRRMTTTKKIITRMVAMDSQVTDSRSTSIRRVTLSQSRVVSSVGTYS